MKNGLDERQQQAADKIAGFSFQVMFMICAAGIMIQLVLLDRGIGSVAGETAALLGGGLCYLAACIKNGLFLEKGRPMNLKSNFMLSIFCSGFFSILFAILLQGKAQGTIEIGKYTGSFFAGIAILCFVVLTIMGEASKLTQRRKDKKYEDE